MSTSLDDVVSDRLASMRSRYTSSRRALVALLAAAGRPMSVAEILAESRRLPRGTVYRNLAVLEDSGVVQAIGVHDDFTRYELAEGLTSHHHHLVCVSCGTLVDVEFAEPLEARLGDEIARWAAATGFAPQRHRVDVFGFCQSCRPS